MDSREESTAVQGDSAPESVRETQEFSEEDGTEGERMAGPSEGEGSAIAPAATRQEALDLHDKAFAEHDFAYLLASCIEPYGQEYVDFLAKNPELYQISLLVEEQLKDCRQKWQGTPGQAFCASMEGALQNGSGDICQKQLADKIKELEKEYREAVS